MIGVLVADMKPFLYEIWAGPPCPKEFFIKAEVS